jgi:hypothetical protein
MGTVEMDTVKKHFIDELSELRDRIAGLNTSLNADLVARFEMSAAMKMLYLYVLRGESSVLAAAGERLRRVLVMVPNSMRIEIGERIERSVQAAGALSPEDREWVSAEWQNLFGEVTVAGPQLHSAVDVVVQEASRVADKASASTSAGWEVENEAFNDEIDRVRDILRRVPVGLERWVAETPDKNGKRHFWQVGSERHVQSVLWLALAPSIPGLKYEETLPSIGRTHPRVDLALPMVGLAIEAKFIQSDRDFARVTEEIAADASLYTSAAAAVYSRLIVFVWDDTRQSERHQQLSEGLKSFRGVIDAIVISRPGLLGNGVAQ